VIPAFIEGGGQMGRSREVVCTNLLRPERKKNGNREQDERKRGGTQSPTEGGSRSRLTDRYVDRMVPILLGPLSGRGVKADIWGKRIQSLESGGGRLRK